VLAQAASRFRDMSIDLEKEKKAAEHTSKVKSEFLANMSHEIRTPMNGVLGMAAQLQETDLSEKQKEMLDVITSSGQSLLVVINDILDLSKIEANKIDLEKQPIDLEKMFRTLEFFFKKQALDKGVKLSFEVPDQRVVFLGDETRLKQVLINILGNAIKFTDNGEVVVNAKAVIEANKKVSLLFSITDTGIGIETEYLDRLFDAFSQADTSITRKFGGTGLGLTITSKLLKLMGSELKVDSQVGCGSKFYFEMEAEVSDQEETISDESYKTPTTETFDYSQLKVLVAEDNKTNQIVIKGLLSKLNVGSIVVAEDGERAIEQCLEHEFDLIFMDMQMPVLDGLQATLQIKAMRKYRDIPIIALTANVFEEDKKKCSEVGMCDFIGKPIDMGQLAEVLNKWSIT
jgi:CheY-like chemotaxis protein/nitrogen-specific signal transduction histidine kinase